MDGQDPPRQSYLCCLFGLAAHVLAATSASAQGNEARFQEPALEALQVKHYRLDDSHYPRLGFLLPPSDIPETGENFEFCDGSRTVVAVDRLSLVRDSCDRHRKDAFSGKLVLDHDSDTPIGKVYGAEYKEIGEIVGIDMQSERTNGASVFNLMVRPTYAPELKGETAPDYIVIDAGSDSADFQIDSSGNPSLLIRDLETTQKIIGSGITRPSSGR